MYCSCLEKKLNRSRSRTAPSPSSAPLGRPSPSERSPPSSSSLVRYNQLYYQNDHYLSIINQVWCTWTGTTTLMILAAPLLVYMILNFTSIVIFSSQVHGLCGVWGMLAVGIFAREDKISEVTYCQSFNHTFRAYSILPVDRGSLSMRTMVCCMAITICWVSR